MKTFFAICALFMLNHLRASDIFSVRLQKSEKLEGTYSAILSQKSTIHFVLVRDTETKEYRLIWSTNLKR